MGEPPFTPAGENLEHNTLVAAQPNLNADGAFRLPPSIGLVDWGAQGGEVGGVARLKNWTSAVCFVAPVECDLPSSSNSTFKPSVEMCQNLVSVGTSVGWKEKIHVLLTDVFFSCKINLISILITLKWDHGRCQWSLMAHLLRVMLEFRVWKRPFVVTFNE